MNQPAFHHIRSWIFDLDNTLYAAETNLFGLIDERMGAFIGKLLDCDPVEARRVQKAYFYVHGMTLAGLMRHHGTDPHEFLTYVHDIALDRLSPQPRLGHLLRSLPGQCLIFTNADADYANRVLAKMELSDCFVGIHDVHATGYHPKPQVQAYDSLLEQHGICADEALFVEDMGRNLVPAKQRGMTTIWLNNGSEGGRHDLDQSGIDHEIDNLECWLEAVIAGLDNASASPQAARQSGDTA